MLRTNLLFILLFTGVGWADCQKQYSSNEELTGALRCLDDQGRLQSLSFYRKGLLNGESKVWDSETGSLLESSLYVDGELEGVRRTFYRGGSVQTETCFHKNKREGIERELALDGRTRMAREWHEDAWSRATFFDEAERISRQEDAVDSEGNVHFRNYHRNGKLSAEGSYLEGHPDLFEGLKRSFRLDGTLEEENRFQAGNKDGLQKAWDENSRLRLRDWYQNGQLISHAEYDPDGRLLQEEEFFSLESPVAIAKYSNGKVDESSQIALGKRQGTHREFDEKGTLRLESNYERGILDGTVKSYFPDGKRSQFVEFHRGERHGLEETYYQNGKLRSHGFNKEGVRDGKWQQFDAYGRLVWDGAYLRGRPEGWVVTLGSETRERTLYEGGILVARQKEGPDSKKVWEESYYPDGSPKL